MIGWRADWGRHQLPDLVYDWWTDGVLRRLRARIADLEARAARCERCRPEDVHIAGAAITTLAQVTIPATPGAVRTQH